jgi:hypothetical protein
MHVTKRGKRGVESHNILANRWDFEESKFATSLELRDVCFSALNSI